MQPAIEADRCAELDVGGALDVFGCVVGALELCDVVAAWVGDGFAELEVGATAAGASDVIEEAAAPSGVLLPGVVTTGVLLALTTPAAACGEAEPLPAD